MIVATRSNWNSTKLSFGYFGDCPDKRTEKSQSVGRIPRRLIRGERGVDVGVNFEDLVEAGDFEDGADGLLETDQGERAAILLDILHAFDEGGETGAVDVADPGKIDN